MKKSIKQIVIPALLLVFALTGLLTGGLKLLPGSEQSGHTSNAATVTPASTSLARGSSITVPVKGLSITGMSVTTSIGYMIGLSLDDSINIYFTLMPANGLYVSHIVMVNGTTIKSATAKAGSCSITEENNILTFKSAAFTYTYSLSGNAKNVTITNNDIYSASAITVAYNQYSYNATFQYLDEYGETWLETKNTLEQGEIVRFKKMQSGVSYPLNYQNAPDVYWLDFTNWELISGDQFGSAATQDSVFKAIYTPKEFTVNYLAPDYSIIETKTLKYGDIIPSITPPQIEGRVFSHWESSNSLNIGDNIVYGSGLHGTHYVSFTAVYIVATYSLKFQYLSADGVTWLESTSALDYGTTITIALAPSLPDAYALNFTGWEVVTGNSIGQGLTQSTTLRATYTAKKYSITYKYGDTIIETKSLTHGSTIPSIEPPAHEQGWTFSHWESSSFLTIGDEITGDVVLTAVYSLTIYNVTFEYLASDGVTWLFEIKEVGQNTLLGVSIYPRIPSLYSQDFSHWETISGDVVGALLTQNTVLRAVYKTAEYTVTYRYNGQTLETKTLIFGEIIPDITLAAHPLGYTFSHWQSSTGQNIGDTITGSITLTAMYVLSWYDVTFKYLSADGTWIVTTQSTVQDTLLSPQMYPSIPDVDGYVFLRWEVVTGNSIGQLLSQNTTITAVYKQLEYIVTYRKNDGTIIEFKTLTYGSIIPEITPPAVERYKFSHWESNVGLTFGNALTQNVTLTAVYVEKAKQNIDILIIKTAENTDVFNYLYLYLTGRNVQHFDIESNGLKFNTSSMLELNWSKIVFRTTVTIETEFTTDWQDFILNAYIAENSYLLTAVQIRLAAEETLPGGNDSDNTDPADSGTTQTTNQDKSILDNISSIPKNTGILIIGAIAAIAIFIVLAIVTKSLKKVKRSFKPRRK